MTNANPVQPKPREVKIRVHDGVDIAVALYMPQGDGPFPVLLAPSPYRYDNNTLPATPQFLWRETGPIALYVERGYVYAHMDIRGCGKSGGEFRLLDRSEQKDLYDVIEWLGHQTWSSGMVGDFFGAYWWNQNRIINRYPANGEFPREQPYDLNLRIQEHPTYDDFWRERTAAEHLDRIEVPLYSVGVWGK